MRLVVDPSVVMKLLDHLDRVGPRVSVSAPSCDGMAGRELGVVPDIDPMPRSRIRLPALSGAGTIGGIRFAQQTRIRPALSCAPLHFIGVSSQFEAL
jgi:hypothetical protein